jgi:hypothetical protein
MTDPKGIACDCGSCRRRVLESRPLAGGVRRRCQCQDCGARFTTYEQRQGDDDSPPLVPVEVSSSRLLQLLCTLLERRHLLPNGQILDCLQLARYGAQGRRLRYEQLPVVLACSDARNAYNRLMAMRRRGLVAVESGGPAAPGYLLRRVGPA